jgi:hypothetical protein
MGSWTYVIYDTHAPYSGRFKKEMGTSYATSIKEARSLAKEYVRRTGRSTTIEREGALGRVNFLEEWGAEDL